MMDESEIIGADINSEIVKGDDDVDWISKLPDCVLTDILSRLDPIEVIETCVLSKRWCKLWAFVPCLRFTIGKFKRTSETKKRARERFENFVGSFLRLRDDSTDLHHFSISSYSEVKLSGCTAATWVLYAAKHNPKKLHINLSGHDQIYWPDCLFTCKSLENIRLNYEMKEENRIEIEPDKVCLPNLTKLDLNYAFINGDSMEKILFGCPALENLTMTSCTLEMNSISFQTVKRLEMFECNFVSEVIPPTYPISAPRVEYLSFAAQLGTGAKLQDMPMLTDARINLDDNDIMDSDDYNLELFSGLSSVENLVIDSLFIEDMLEAELPRCSKVFNLKKLCLAEMCMCCHFRLLSSFLELCPNLEVLILSHTDEDCLDVRIQDEHGSFGCDYLRKIDITYSRRDRKVDRLIGLLLKSTVEISDLKITLDKCLV